MGDYVDDYEDVPQYLPDEEARHFPPHSGSIPSVQRDEGAYSLYGVYICINTTHCPMVST